MAKRELLRRIDQDLSGAFTSGSFIGGTPSASAHRMLSPTHSDSDASDIPVDGDLMVFSGLWKALTLAELIELIGGLFVGRYEGAHAGLFAYEHEDGTAIEFQVTDTGGQPFVSIGEVLDIPNTSWLRIGYPEYDQITLIDPTSGATDPEQHRGLSIPASAVCGVVPDCLYITDTGSGFPDDGVNAAFQYLVADSASHLLQSGEWAGAQSEAQYFGSVAAGDCLSIDTEGTLRLFGEATDYEDLRVDSLSTRIGVVAPTDETGFRGDANFYARNFVHNQADEVQFTVQMPHAWKEGSNIYPHVHFSPWISSTGDKAAQFILEYFWANVDGTFPASPSNYTMTETWNGDAQWQHRIANNAAPLSATGKTLSSILYCRLYRDNTVGNNLAGKVTFLYFDIHYEVNGFGSKEEYVK